MSEPVEPREVARLRAQNQRMLVETLSLLVEANARAEAGDSRLLIVLGYVLASISESLFDQADLAEQAAKDDDGESPEKVKKWPQRRPPAPRRRSR